MLRIQHPAFGSEIRAVLGSSASEDCDIASTILDALRALDDARRCNRPHPKEDKLNGAELAEVRYLRIYRNKQSIRLYFATIGRALMMLAIDTGKRRDDMTDGMKSRLLERLRDAKGRRHGT